MEVIQKTNARRTLNCAQLSHTQPHKQQHMRQEHGSHVFVRQQSAWSFPQHQHHINQVNVDFFVVVGCVCVCVGLFVLSHQIQHSMPVCQQQR